MTNAIQFNGYADDVFTVSVHAGATGEFPFGIYTSYFVGCSAIMTDGSVIDYPAEPIGRPLIHDIEIIKAFAISHTKLKNYGKTVIAALWDRKPDEKGAVRIAEIRMDAQDLVKQFESGPLYDTSNAVDNTVSSISKGIENSAKTFENLGTILPLILIGIVVLVVVMRK